MSNQERINQELGKLKQLQERGIVGVTPIIEVLEESSPTLETKSAAITEMVLGHTRQARTALVRLFRDTLTQEEQKDLGQ